VTLAVWQPSIDISANVSILFVSSVVANKILSFFLVSLLLLTGCLFTDV